jgi:hypothetical protein
MKQMLSDASNCFSKIPSIIPGESNDHPTTPPNGTPLMIPVKQQANKQILPDSSMTLMPQKIIRLEQMELSL